MKTTKFLLILLAVAMLFSLATVSYANEQSIVLRYENPASYEVVIPSTIPINPGGSAFYPVININNVNVGDGLGVGFSVASKNDFKLVNVDKSSEYITYEAYLNSIVINNRHVVFVPNGTEYSSYECLLELNLDWDNEKGETIYPIGRFTDSWTVVFEIVEEENIGSVGVVFDADTDYFDFKLEDGYIIGTLTSAGLEEFNKAGGQYAYTNFVEYNSYSVHSDSWNLSNPFVKVGYYGPGEYLIYYNEEDDNGSISSCLTTNLTISGTNPSLDEYISFNVGYNLFRAERDMMWYQWINSKYNEYYGDDIYLAPDDSVVVYGSNIHYNGNLVFAGDKIVCGGHYE